MNLVIVEDSLPIRTQLLRLLSFLPRIRVVGMAAGETEAVDIIRKTNPDVVLLDLFLATGNGLNVLTRIRHAGCSARILVLSNHISETMQSACAAIGISGYFDKTYEMPRCIEQLHAWLPPNDGETPPISAGTDSSPFLNLLKSRG